MDNLMTDAQFNEQLEMAVHWAKKVLDDKPQTGFVPSLIALGIPTEPDGKTPMASGPIPITIAMLPDFNADHRHEQIRQVGYRLGKESGPIWAIFLVTEAWLSIQAHDQPRRYAKPEQDPQRQEIVNVAALAIDGRSASAHVKTTRNKKNHFVAGEVVVHPYAIDGKATMQNNICKPFFEGLTLALLEEMAHEGA